MSSELDAVLLVLANLVLDAAIISIVMIMGYRVFRMHMAGKRSGKEYVEIDRAMRAGEITPFEATRRSVENHARFQREAPRWP